MTLDEAKVSAKQGLIAQMNAYIDAALPSSVLVHATVWRLNAIIDGSTPTTGAEATIDAIFNFVVTLQAAMQPFFPQIDAATTVDDVWAAAGGFDPRVIPPPAAAGMAFYANRLGIVHT